jgi:hypothetical protein
VSKYAALASALALAGMTTPAAAATFTPNPSFVNLSGYLTTNETTTLSCYVSLNASVNSGGTSMTITDGVFTGGDWQCGWLILPVAFPWTVTPTSTSSVSISGMALLTPAGACSGTAYVRWRNYAPFSSSLEFWSASIPGAPVNCSFVGDLYVSGGVTLQ